MYGPYDNGGDLARSFAPEDPARLATLQPDTTLIGGTIIWRPLFESDHKGITPKLQQQHLLRTPTCVERTGADGRYVARVLRLFTKHRRQHPSLRRLEQLGKPGMGKWRR